VEQAWLDELNDFLRIPSVSAEAAHADDVRAAGEWVRDFLRRAGGEAELVETDSQPLVIGEIRASDSGANAPTTRPASVSSVSNEGSAVFSPASSSA
jgi:acetylornithine deacetylase/succinyl-diaminopimelate desuccinylase-like protein